MKLNPYRVDAAKETVKEFTKTALGCFLFGFQMAILIPVFVFGALCAIVIFFAAVITIKDPLP